MKNTIILVFFIIKTSFLYTQNKDVFSEDFIKERLILSNAKKPLIKSFYTKDYPIIIREFISLSWFEKAVSMTDYYFPLFAKKALKYNVPTDLKYIAVIESGLRPKITSSAGATGLFQFMPATGNMYGLKETDHLNLFHDIVANSDCAMRYFKDLFTKYNDWKFVLCAYNYGLGNVDKKIRKVGSNNFNDVYNHFPKETRNYIKRFLVAKYLIENKDIYFPKRRRFKYSFNDFKMIRIEKATTITLLAKQYKNENLIRFVNSHLKTNFIPLGTFVYIKK